MYKKSNFIGILFFIICISALAQKKSDIDQYNKAKEELKNENFQESAKLFSELYKSLGDKNDLSAYAYYFSAYANYKLGNLKDANFILFQLISKYPDWRGIDKAYYLKAIVQSESKNYADANIQFAKTGVALSEEVKKAKGYHYDKLTTDTLEILKQKFLDDEIIKTLITSRLPKSKKDKMNIAVLLPFENATRNHFIYELYTGMMLGADSLNRAGLNIQLIPYETGKDSIKIKEFVNTREARNFDLIIGPLYMAQQSFISKFALDNNVNIVNPLSSYAIHSNFNPNYFLLKPSYETQGKKAADYAFTNFISKNAIIIYGDEGGDSLAAKSYRSEYEQIGGKVLIFRKLTKFNSGYFAPILSKVRLDSIGHIYVASSEPSVAANIFSHLESVLLDQTSKYKDNRSDEEKELERRKKDEDEKGLIKRTASDVPIIAPSSWLDFESISYEQFMLHNTHFIYPNFVDTGSLSGANFLTNYQSKVGLNPSNYAYQGFDLMLYYGNLLGKYGRKFNEKIQTESITKGFYSPYFDYTHQNDNGFVPIVKIENFKLKLVNQP